MNRSTTQSVYSFMINYSDVKNVPSLAYFSGQVAFGDMLLEIDRVAYYLMSAGVKKGDCVCICLPNIPQAVEAFYAINRVGAIANLVHPLINPLGLREKIVETKSKIVFLAKNLYKQYADALSGLDLITCVCAPEDCLPAFAKFLYGLKAADADCQNALQKYKPFDFKILKGNTQVAFPEVAPDDIAAYMHSGGTTGEPKTVVLTNQNINEEAAQVAASLCYNMHEGKTLLAALPMFHGFGLAVCIHLGLSTRTRVALAPQFKPKEIVKLIGRYKINMLIGVPQIYAKLLAEKSFKRKAIKNITHCYCGGERLSDNIRSGFETLLSAFGSEAELLEGYGLTEAVSVCSLNRPMQNKKGSVGKPLDGVKLMIVDKDKNQLSANQIGQICVCTPTLMAGYFKDKKATDEAVFYLNGERWLLTGDLGYIDEDGYLFFTDRLKRIIVVAGINVFPVEIEAVADAYKGVKRSCAVEKSVYGKQIIALYVELDSGVEFDEVFLEGLKARLQLRLNKWSQPKLIVPIKKLPLTRVGKVDAIKLAAAESDSFLQFKR